jgi:hypothetical protein
MKRTKIWIAVFTIFLSGLLAGFVGGLATARYQVFQIIEKGPEGIHRVVMRRLTHELNLTDAQRKAVEPIIVRAQNDLHRFRINQQPAIQRIIDQALFEIRPELTDEQNKKLDDLHQRINRHWGVAEKKP